MAEIRHFLGSVVPPAGEAQARDFNGLRWLPSYFGRVFALADPRRLANRFVGRMTFSLTFTGRRWTMFSGRLAAPPSLAVLRTEPQSSLRLDHAAAINYRRRMK